MWLYPMVPLECVIADLKKESKLYGLKSFIEYQITPNVGTTGAVAHTVAHPDKPRHTQTCRETPRYAHTHSGTPKHTQVHRYTR